MVQGYSESGPGRAKWNTQPSTPLNSRVHHRVAITSKSMHNLAHIFVFVLTTQVDDDLGYSKQESKVYTQFQS